jgi:glycosyltransferase involved in cell wall biosynthesis
VRVLVDATPLRGPRTGIGVFVQHLVDALSTTVDVGTFTVDRASMRVPARVLHELWRRVDWPVVGDASTDVVHGTNFVVPPTRGAARVVTVHDLTMLRYPQMVTPATRAYPRLVQRALRQGAWVHTPSRFVAAEVVEAFGADPARVRPIAHGIAAPADAKPAYDFPYVFALGTVEPRKDLGTLVRAFDSLAASDPDLRLVVAGASGWGADPFANAAHGERIMRLGYVDDDRRAALLAGARVFAYPSRYEGFGLPPLEAMAAGVPVVTTNAGALPEVVGDAALLVEPGRPDVLAEALAEVLTDDERRAGLIERGYARAASRSWEHAAADMVELYQDASR